MAENIEIKCIRQWEETPKGRFIANEKGELIWFLRIVPDSPGMCEALFIPLDHKPAGRFVSIDVAQIAIEHHDFITAHTFPKLDLWQK